MAVTWSHFVSQGGWWLVIVVAAVSLGMILSNCWNAEGRSRDRR